METYLLYLLKSGGILFLFYASYQIFLRKETFFTAHRWFLVVGLIAAIILPSIYLTKTIPISTNGMEGINASWENNAAIAKESILSSGNVLMAIYLLGGIIFAFRLAAQIRSVLLFMRSGKKNTTGRLTYVQSTKNVQPFSFFNHIVYNPGKHSEQELESILAHEKIHALQNHTIDILCMELFVLFQWFNPFAWFYKKALKQNLEFLADTKNSSLQNNRKQYQYVLLTQSVGKQHMPIVNPFYNSLIKKRIVMINQAPSKKRKILKSLVIVPLLALFLVGFNTKTVYEFQDSSQTQMEGGKIGLIINKDTSEDELSKMKADLAKENIDFSYTSVRNDQDEIISFSLHVKGPNNSASLNSTCSDVAIKPMYVMVNLSTNEIAVGNGSYKKPGHSSLHLYNSDGQSSKKIRIRETDDESTVTINGEDVSEEDLEDMDIRITGYGGSDISISHNGDHDQNRKVRIQKSKSGSYTYLDIDGNDPLYVVDGKETQKDVFEELDTDHIESINVLKGKKALEKYGKRAKNGVVEIKTKKKK